MLFGFMFKKKRVMDKSVSNYVHFRVKKKRAFDEQKKLLDTRLQHKEIELDTYERSIDILEIEYYKQQLEEWEKVQTKFQNPFTS